MAKYSLKQLNDYIHVVYAHKEQRMRISTKFRADGLYDTKTHNLNQRHPDYEKAHRIVDSIMDGLLRATTKIKAAGFEPTVGMVRQEYKKLLKEVKDERKPKKVKEPSFFQLMDRHLQSKVNIRTLTTYTNLNQSINTLREFEKHSGKSIDIESFDRQRFNELIDFYIKEKRYSDSNIDKHLRCLRAFMKTWYPSYDRSFMSYKMRKDENIVYLTDEELRLLIEADLTGYLDKTRDLFVFCCLTGMRYSDLASFDPAWIQDGVFVFNQVKTGGVAMPPLFKGAEQILNKHKGQLPVISNVKMNKYVKDLCKVVLPERMVERVQFRGGTRIVTQIPLHGAVTTHTARKTFITLALAHGIPIQDVMKMSGHTDFRGIRPYIAVSKEHIKRISKKWDI